MVSRLVASVWCKPTRAAGVRRVLQQWGVRRVALYTTVVRVAAAGRASLLGATLLRLEPSSRGSPVRLGSPWWALQSSLTLCATRDQRVPAGKSGRSLRLGAPPLLLIEGAARCRRRTRLTPHRVAWRVCDPNPINTAHARAAARRVGAVHLALAPPFWGGGRGGCRAGVARSVALRVPRPALGPRLVRGSGRGLGLGRLPG